VKETERKMARWIENGVAIAWLVNPYNRTVTVYRAGGEIQVEAGDRVAGTGPVAGFVLELEDVWGSYTL